MRILGKYVLLLHDALSLFLLVMHRQHLQNYCKGHIEVLFLMPFIISLRRFLVRDTSIFYKDLVKRS